MTCLKSHNEFDVIDGNVLKSFLAENLVMNYSNIELHRVILQQKQNPNANSFSQYAASSNNTLKKQLQMRVHNPQSNQASHNFDPMSDQHQATSHN